MLAEAGVEERIARLWVEDAKDADPSVRMNARRDLMDRFIGKPAQSVSLSIEDPEDVEWGGEAP
jgi:hypothetical protein